MTFACGLYDRMLSLAMGEVKPAIPVTPKPQNDAAKPKAPEAKAPDAKPAEKKAA